MIRPALEGLGIVQPRQIVDRSNFTPSYPFDMEDGSDLVLQTLLGAQETVAPTFTSFIQRAYRESPVTFALIQNRAQLFSEVRFQWLERVNGRPGDIFGTPELKIIEKPWPQGTTRDLLKVAETHNAGAGNFFAARRGDRLRVLRPDWTEIILGTDQQVATEDGYFDATDIDAEVLGYLYWEGGRGGGRGDAVFLEVGQVVHYKPTIDPVFPWRGVAWLGPIIQDLCADREMTAHKRKYLQGGATPNLAMVLDPGKLNIRSPDDFEEWVKKFEELRDLKSGGNPYKIMFTIAGADPTVIGANLDQIDFSKVQGSGEVRMAAAAMVHPSIVAIESGLQGSALNAGNFESAFRQFANGTMRPLWGAMAAALENVIPKPTRNGQPRENVELTYDDRDVPALQEDEKKRAETEQVQAGMITALIREGFTADSVIVAITTHDFSRLVHTGLVSVQLQEPGVNDTPPQNGSGPPSRVPAP